MKNNIRIITIFISTLFLVLSMTKLCSCKIFASTANAQKPTTSASGAGCDSRTDEDSADYFSDFSSGGEDVGGFSDSEESISDNGDSFESVSEGESDYESEYESYGESLSESESEEEPVHIHVYEGYEYDENGHRKVCAVCGEYTEIEEHCFDGGSVVLDATPYKSGIICYTCTQCGYFYEERIEFSSDDFVTEEAWNAAVKLSFDGEFCFDYFDGGYENYVDYCKGIIRFRKLSGTEITEEKFVNNKRISAYKSIIDLFISGMPSGYDDYTYKDGVFSSSASGKSVEIKFYRGKIVSMSVRRGTNGILSTAYIDTTKSGVKITEYDGIAFAVTSTNNLCVVDYVGNDGFAYIPTTRGKAKFEVIADYAFAYAGITHCVIEGKMTIPRHAFFGNDGLKIFLGIDKLSDGFASGWNEISVGKAAIYYFHGDWTYGKDGYPVGV
ncbi:MAG: hypothetical protein IJ706_05085 [Clostridia bacterium]|nr:hypothetical protein [Clostridia bacterium]